jgi:MFS family permease
MGHPEKLRLTGEQSIYILAASLFLVTGFFLIFCIEETRMPSAPNKTFREMFFGKGRAPEMLTGHEAGEAAGLAKRLKQVPIVAFVTSFARDVFLKRENYPYYIVLVIPAIEASVWGNFNPLMQNDQFGYSKQAQANWAFPMQILSFFVLTPFAGWYSDVRVNVRWWMRILLVMVSAASLMGMLWVLRHYSPADIRAVPSFWVLAAVTVLTALSMGTFYVPIVEIMLDWVGREHARAWVSLLTVVKSMITVALLYIWIQRSEGQVLPIMVWMVFAVINGTLGALMDTFIGPMIYDYMPRSQMGTINSGKGIYENFILFGAANLGAWWIVFFTTYIHKPAHVDYDYTSMYILQFLLFIPAIWAKVYFIRLIAKGKMKKWGTMEVEGDASEKEAAAQHETAVVAAD